MLWKIANGDWNDHEFGACLAESIFEFVLTCKPADQLHDACSEWTRAKPPEGGINIGVGSVESGRIRCWMTRLKFLLNLS